MTKEKEKDAINALLKRWSDVQADLKKVEHIGQLAILPAINELRYAGRIIVTVLSRNQYGDEVISGVKEIEDDIDNRSILDCIIVADQYITNAEHDISDALIYLFKKKIDSLNDRYGTKVMQKNHKGYEGICNTLDEAIELIIKARGNTLHRSKNYKTVKELSIKLIKDYNDLEVTSAYLSVELYENELKHQVELNRYKQYLVVTAIALVVATLLNIFL